jgi:uncharacterized protein YjbI with pentapeptide repeats
MIRFGRSRIRPTRTTRASLVVIGSILVLRSLWPYVALRFGIPTLALKEISTATYSGLDAEFPGALLPFARLANTHLGWSNLAGANLFEADLSASELSGANLSRATLRGARLARADLAAYRDEGTLVVVDLSHADLRQSNLRGTDLSAADLRAADLRDADLSGANLKDAKLAGATYDANTHWPAGFDPRRHGAKLVE